MYLCTYYDSQKRQKSLPRQQEAAGLCNKDSVYCESGNQLLDIGYIKFLLEEVNINYLANRVEQV
jgi:alanyl-tRNA synthetase